MATKFNLNIIKTEYTLNGINLNRDERCSESIKRIEGFANPGVVQHETVLLDKTFTTAKGAWAFLTPELLDGLGLVWNGHYCSYDTDFVEYLVDVTRVPGAR